MIFGFESFGRLINELDKLRVTEYLTYPQLLWGFIFLDIMIAFILTWFNYSSTSSSSGIVKRMRKVNRKKVKNIKE